MGICFVQKLIGYVGRNNELTDKHSIDLKKDKGEY